MSGARERMEKGSGESHQRQRRDQKDSNDLLTLTTTDELQLTAFDCSDYNIGRNQFPEEVDGEEQEQPNQEPDFADSNEDLLEHGGEDSNDLAVYDLATLCLVDADAEEGPDLYLCNDIGEAKGRIIPYEYRVYLSKNVDDSNKEEDGSPVALASKAGSSAGSSTAGTSRIDTVQDVESRIMAQVASKMGLADCDASISSSLPNPALRRRSLSSTNSLESARHRRLAEGDNTSSPAPLIGISSDPIDGISDCPENSPNLPFHCMYVQGHLAAYFDVDTDDATMTNYANVIVNQINVGMDTDAFIDDRAKLVMYVPPELASVPTIATAEVVLKDEMTSEDLNISSPSPQSSSSNTTYIGIGVGCVALSAVLLSLFVFMRRRRIQKFVGRPTEPTNANTRCRRESPGVSDTERAIDGNDSFCIEVEVSDNETVAMSVNRDGRVGKVAEKTDSQGTAATEDDCETIATHESGVTLYLDLKRVGSDVSALTWYGPANSSNCQSNGSLGRGLEAIAGMGAIQEDEEEEEEEEDDLNLEISTEEDTGGSGGSKNQFKSTVASDSLCYSSTASGSRRIV
eukprot:CAMPEP_0181044470 /NCGR_PEP_ID=MMETSP1070-20121207/13285_1 /TAXON_ID=265543 /ORGANISM="Minutocellus polymorphus, Strain NH13" /LENGTH=571 /DNA_ID=CAMNT_0023122921 /DNA_START=120 /DNA_END=1835 /DNA_ORIENTATION=+